MKCKHERYTQLNAVNGDMWFWYCLDCKQPIDKPRKEKMKEFMFILMSSLAIIILFVAVLIIWVVVCYHVK